MLRRPALADVRQPATARFIEAFTEASALQTDRYPGPAPADAFTTAVNRAGSVAAAPAGTARKLFINREPGATSLTLWGTIAIDDPGANEGLAIEDPAEFAASLLRHLLAVRGVAVYGKQRARHTELASLSTFSVTASAGARGGDDTQHPVTAQNLVLATYQSKPLLEDLTFNLAYTYLETNLDSANFPTSVPGWFASPAAVEGEHLTFSPRHTVVLLFYISRLLRACTQPLQRSL